MALVDHSKDLGPLQVGNLISSFLYGCVTFQTYYYFKNYHDTLSLKLLVAATWGSELGHQLCLWAACFSWMVASKGEIKGHELPLPKSIDAVIIFNALVILLAQAFFIMRLYKLTRQLALPLFLSGCVIARLALGLVVSTRGFRTRDLPHLKISSSNIIAGLWILGIIFDALVTAALFWDLYRKRNQATLMRTTARLVDKLMVWCLATGLMVCLDAIMLTALYFAYPLQLIWTCPWLCLPALYANSMLFALNARRQLRKGTETMSFRRAAALEDLLMSVP